jgi:hypothetical protein
MPLPGPVTHGNNSGIFAVMRQRGLFDSSREFAPERAIAKGTTVRKRSIASGVLGVGMILALASCTNPYDPGQRAVGGGLIGAGAGAAIGAAAGGGAGAAIGAATGGALGAVTGAATTPPPPPPPGYYPPPPPGY